MKRKTEVVVYFLPGPQFTQPCGNHWLRPPVAKAPKSKERKLHPCLTMTGEAGVWGRCIVVHQGPRWGMCPWGQEAGLRLPLPGGPPLCSVIWQLHAEKPSFEGTELEGWPIFLGRGHWLFVLFIFGFWKNRGILEWQQKTQIIVNSVVFLVMVTVIF